MEKPTIAICPEGFNGNSLTGGKEYLISSIESLDPHYGVVFWIKNDIEGDCYCLERRCAWLNGGEWTLKQREQ